MAWVTDAVAVVLGLLAYGAAEPSNEMYDVIKQKKWDNAIFCIGVGPWIITMGRIIVIVLILYKHT